jgi:hypothetical protein
MRVFIQKYTHGSVGGEHGKGKGLFNAADERAWNNRLNRKFLVHITILLFLLPEGSDIL